jgi:hypothetical protein
MRSFLAESILVGPDTAADSQGIAVLPPSIKGAGSRISERARADNSLTFVR